jgi:hypothetical protein
MNKHNIEVDFLFNARGLELFIVETKKIADDLQNMNFVSAFPKPEKPIKPEKKKIIAPYLYYEVGTNFWEPSGCYELQSDSDIMGNRSEKGLFDRIYLSELNSQNIGKLKGKKLIKYIHEYINKDFYQVANPNDPHTKHGCKYLWLKKEFSLQKYHEEVSDAEQFFNTQMALFEKLTQQYNCDTIEFQKNVEQEKTNWLENKQANIQFLNQGITQAQQELSNLYNSALLLPKPYQYVEAVCYLYDFLSTSSDDYDIKYALERCDFAEMKKMMRQIIDNQGQQILLDTIAVAQRQTQQNQSEQIISSLENIESNTAENVRANNSLISATNNLSVSVKDAASTTHSYNKNSLSFLSDATKYLEKSEYYARNTYYN